MKRSKLFLLMLLPAAALLAGGCADSADRAPTLVGVRDIQCFAESTVDLLQSVAALDREDGDITADIVITVKPHVDVEDGYAYFTQVGEYEVGYKITDSGGNEAEEKAFVDVVERDRLKSFSEPDGMYCEASGRASIEKFGLVNGVFKVNATGGEIAEDIKLTRTYALTKGVDYTFYYEFTSNRAGLVKVAANGGEIAEREVVEGDNVLTFTHKIPDYEESSDAQIALWLGNLGDGIELTVKSVYYEYPQAAGNYELLDGFVMSKDKNVFDRFDGTAGKVEAGADGKSAKLTVTSGTGNAADNWRGGMFINTGVPLTAGGKYHISFNTSANSDPYEVCIQRAQWGDNGPEIIDVIESPQNGANGYDLTVTDATAGTLWLYVRSGGFANEITISDISVKEERSGGTKRDFLDFGDFTQKTDPNYESAFSTDCGKFIYTAKTFSATDNHHEVTSVPFYQTGKGNYYILTFKAKATKPVKFLITSPTVDGNWSDVIFFSNENTITQEEQVITVYGNSKAVEGARRLIWQFGAAENQKYTDVTIEISDIKISYKSDEFDK